MSATESPSIPLEIEILIRPGFVYRQLGAHPPSQSGRWLYVRRPLIIALILGAGISLLVASRLSIELLISTTLCWSFVPLAEIAGLLVVSRRTHQVSLAQRVDLFLLSHTPWLIWIAILGALGAFLPLLSVFKSLESWTLMSGAVALVWSLWIDYHYFREVERAANGAAIGKLIVQRLVSWSLIVAIFSYGSFWPSMLEVFRR